ncbi:MAG TPA: hypothetical protein VJO53_08495 [Candidatus Acidoferrales bacterium]|nr:hypothetical protein [Candidatus Acidoferrales bacterium]
MRTSLGCAVLSVAIALYAPLLPANRQSDAPEAGVIICRVLELHRSAHPAVVAVVFHQQNRADQARLAAMLKQHSGASAEIQAGDGAWTQATVVRLKSCFGRGLLLLPAEAPSLKDGGAFRLKFPPSGAAD